LVSTLDEKGIPTVVDRVLIAPPQSRVGPATDEERKASLNSSPLFGRYDNLIDRESAFEILRTRGEQVAQQQAAAEQAEAEAKQAKAEEKAAGPSRRSDSVVESMVKSVARAAGSQLGRQLIRGVLGGLFGGSTGRKRR
jgi:hypothetical protein